ncbi:MAG: putative capsid protein [Cressdnaviricota sp.]|nr:MAG: putative capsid protein [Cressdnaviricota sp.]
MPPKTNRRRKVRKDKKQDTRIASLENFVYKTIENKQQNFHQHDLNVSDIGNEYRPNMLITTGVDDGAGRPSAARIGNSITLMNQRFNFEVRMNSAVNPQATPAGITARLIVAESVDGAEDLQIEDILEYWKTQSGTATGAERETYTSHYTTKSSINKRYKIHMDKIMYFTEGVNLRKSFKLNIRYGSKKNPGKVVDYPGGGLENQPVNHKLTIMAVSDTGATAYMPRLSYSVRSTYKDA